MRPSDRYGDRPILVFIESYLLAVIGKLPDAKSSAMMRVARRVWGGNFNWMATLRSQLGWPSTVDAHILRTWHAYQAAAKVNAIPENPDEFAILMADTIIERAGR